MSGSLKTNARLIADCHAFWKVRFAAKDTGQRVRKFATVVCGLALLEGCTLENQLMTPPQTSGKASAPVEPDDSDRLGDGCELKNSDGTGGCEGGTGHTTVKKQMSAEEQDKFWQDYSVYITSCLGEDLSAADRKRQLALRDQERYLEAAKVCNNGKRTQVVEEAVAPPNPPPAPEYSTPASQTGGGSVPQDGTWYCDNLTGSGQYGTWEMTQHPQVFDVASCYRVD